MPNLRAFSGKLSVIAFAILGLWLVVIRPLGPHWSMLPGGGTDSSLNMFLLEHFYRWVTGVDPSFWTAGSFYPFPNAIAFGDSFLGTGLVFAAFRSLGLDRESAFQGWYLVGYAANYAAAAYVLSRLHLRPLAASVAAFFFSFGLPVLAQENHVQLVYRFGVPLACCFLWEMAQRPRVGALAAVLFWLVWQFFASIYIGVFLSLLLLILALLAPFCLASGPIMQRVRFWPDRLSAAWRQAVPIQRVLECSAGGFLIAMLALLLRPYWDVNRIYGFGWRWDYVATMLPTWRSLLLADRSLLWKPISGLFPDFDGRVEHQLFPGVAAATLEGIGLVALGLRLDTEARRAVWLHFLAGMSLVVMTFLLGGFSLWHILWSLPGTGSIRAVTRIVLVVMWPLALVIGYAIDQLLGAKLSALRLRAAAVAILSVLLVTESVLFDHYVYSKAGLLAHLQALRTQLPAATPERPILVLSAAAGPVWTEAEVDAMLLGQDLGWPVLNGYGGNFAPGYGPTDSCRRIPERIIAYMDFAGIRGRTYYRALIRRTVPIGFSDCDPAWWMSMPR